jgi:hypothetical protein
MNEVVNDVVEHWLTWHLDLATPTLLTLNEERQQEVLIHQRVNVGSDYHLEQFVILVLRAQEKDTASLEYELERHLHLVEEVDERD